MKSQSSYELVVLIAFLIAISVGIILLFQTQFPVSSTSSQRKIEDVCKNVATKINTVYQYGAGSEQNTTLPAMLENQDYTVAVADQLVICRLGSFSSIESLLTNNVKNATNNQSFEIPKRQIRI